MQTHNSSLKQFLVPATWRASLFKPKTQVGVTQLRSKHLSSEGWTLCWAIPSPRRSFKPHYLANMDNRKRSKCLSAYHDRDLAFQVCSIRSSCDSLSQICPDLY